MPKISLEEEQKLVEVARKDPEAFGKLYDLYFDAIYRYVFRRISDRETTEDIVSQTFFDALNKISKFKFRGFPFSAWLYKIAHNNVLQHYRKTKGRETVNLDSITELKDSKINIKKDFAQGEKREVMQVALRKLKEKEQEIILLKYFEEFSNQEIANILNLSANNVAVRVHRALTSLEKILENECVNIEA